MKKQIHYMLTATILILSAQPCQAEETAKDSTVNRDGWRLAVDVLKGKDKSKEKSWAFSLLSESQEGEKDAFVQNVLGIACLHGIGTEADTVAAVSHFEESGALGYPLAWHNLGMYYKYASDGRQDFQKASEAFRKGAETGDPSCCYDYAFMKYKGLGCRQDYAGAVELFGRAADFNHAPSIYMLGLCYRNGYGVEADTAIGNLYLRDAAGLGYRDAAAELLNEEPENRSVWNCATAGGAEEYPETMPEIEAGVPLNSKVMTGSYQGLLVTYDWSGEYVLTEKPLMLDMQVQRDTARGVWIQGRDTVRFAASVGTDGSFLFAGVEKELDDRYSPGFTSRYRFEQVDMNYCRGYITGRLRLYSLDEMEPERPMYVALKKDGLTEGADAGEDEFAKIVAYSDPYSSRITLKFELSEAAESVRVGIYDRTSVCAGTFSYGAMEAGVNTLTLYPNLRAGYYVIYVTAGTQKFQAVIVL